MAGTRLRVAPGKIYPQRLRPTRKSAVENNESKILVLAD